MEFGIWTLMVLMTPRTETLWVLGSKLISSDPTPLFLGVLGVLFLFVVFLAMASFVAFCKHKVDQKRRKRARKSRRVAILRGERYQFSLAELQQIQYIRNLQRSPLEAYREDPHWEHLLCISPSCKVCRNKIIPAAPHGLPAPNQADPSGSLPPSTIPMASPGPVTSAADPRQPACNLPGLHCPLCSLQAPGSGPHPTLQPAVPFSTPSPRPTTRVWQKSLCATAPPPPLAPPPPHPSSLSSPGITEKEKPPELPHIISGPQSLPPSETIGHTADLSPFPVCASGPPHGRRLNRPPEPSRRQKVAPHTAGLDTKKEPSVLQGQRQQGRGTELSTSLAKAAEAYQTTAPPVDAVPTRCYSQARTLDGQHHTEPCALSPSLQAVDTQHTESGRPRFFLNFHWKIRSPRRLFQRRQSPRVGRFMRALRCCVPCLHVQNDI